MLHNQTTTSSTIDPRQVFLDSLGGELALNDDFLHKHGYPAHTMTCASEIFNIWVCRMIMLGYHFTGKPPFEQMFVHAVARDEKGRKMSKSLGNGIDPSDMIDRFSADSLRMALNSLIVPGRDALMSQKSADELVTKWRNFGNKLWNVARFLYEDKAVNDSSKDQISSASGWIWEKLDTLSQNIAQNMASYRLGQVMDDIYHFVWDDLADWYIEYLKTAPDQLYFARKHVFEPLIKLIHPFVPFETEAIWKEISELDPTVNPKNELLVSQSFSLPKVDIMIFDSSQFESIISFIRAFRQLRGLYRIDPALKIQIFSTNLLLKEYSLFIRQVAKLELVDINNTKTPTDAQTTDLARYFTQKWSDIDFSFDLVSIIPDLPLELSRTREDLQKTESDILKLENLLSNQGFVAKAGEETIEKTKADLSNKIEQKHEFELKIQWIEGQI